MAKGNINVSVENIFPLIKKFLYSDHEIFLRELISNATDATLKLKHLTSIGEAKVEYGNPKIEVKIDKDNKTLHIIDQGLGMTAEEVEKYINQVAFSGAEEFLEKYKDSAKDSGIIGHFGLGFYSAFMVADKVEIISKSYKEGESAVHWTCDGSPEFTLEETTAKTDRGTEIILHIAEDSTEFLEESRIRELLLKYNKFMPVPIKFGMKTETLPLPEGAAEDAKPETIEVDNIINNPNPAWTKSPSELTNEDYQKFYHELYPMQFEEPLFNIHLNVDYPFNLTGILFFPKLGNNLNIEKDKIQLYQNQVFVTDEVKGIVPDFLMLLRGVIDSPDIPLNVSRSYLQSDHNVKKISNHITKKVADRLEEIFKNDRPQFEEKWDSLKIFIEYGMLTDEKFYDRAQKFCLLKNVDSKIFTFEEYKTLISANQTDKDDTLVYLYTNNKEEQYSYINAAKEHGYDVLLLDGQLDVHLAGMLESKFEKSRFVRIDSDIIDNIIKKEDLKDSDLNDEQKEKLNEAFKSQLPVIDKVDFSFDYKPLKENVQPIQITQDEYMRRMKEMAALQTGMAFYGDMPDHYKMVVNTNHPLVKQILSDVEAKDKDAAVEYAAGSAIMRQLIDLALLSNNMLKGEALSSFIKRSTDIISSK